MNLRRRTTENRRIEFRGTRGGALERAVTLADGRHYLHRCTQQAFERIVAHLDDHADESFTVFGIAELLDIPYTQATVAIDLLDERGMLSTEGRRRYVDDGYKTAFFEHAMTEFHALIGGQAPDFRDR
ncbi:MAG: hypothetical protein WD294_02230 [Phycisphaeraceae bacterium]